MAALDADIVGRVTQRDVQGEKRVQGGVGALVMAASNLAQNALSLTLHMRRSFILLCAQACAPVSQSSATTILRGEEVVVAALNVACHQLATNPHAFWMACRRIAGERG